MRTLSGPRVNGVLIARVRNSGNLFSLKRLSFIFAGHLAVVRIIVACEQAPKWGIGRRQKWSLCYRGVRKARVDMKLFPYNLGF